MCSSRSTARCWVGCIARGCRRRGRCLSGGRIGHPVAAPFWQRTPLECPVHALVSVPVDVPATWETAKETPGETAEETAEESLESVGGSAEGSTGVRRLLSEHRRHVDHLLTLQIAMTHLRPTALDLSPDEATLARRIDFCPDQLRLSGRFEQVVRGSCAAASRLAKSLLARSAIPEIRLAYFTDARFNIGSKRSRKEVFESNGTSGDAILEHPNFLKYLRYFVYGPNLPPATIAGFCRLVEENRGTSGMVLDALRTYARREVRKGGPNAHDASEEFFKLALECGLDEGFARSIRDAAPRAR